MKTAEEWIKHLARLGIPTNSPIMVIEAIQQDAYLSGQLKGTLDAAEIINEHEFTEKEKNWPVTTVTKLIIAAHDKLKATAQ